MADTDPPDPALMLDSFSFAHPMLLFARVRLYDDRLELTGWRLWEHYRHRIPLARILKVDAPSANELLLWMADGRTLRLRLDEAQRWRRAIARRLEAP